MDWKFIRIKEHPESADCVQLAIRYFVCANRIGLAGITIMHIPFSIFYGFRSDFDLSHTLQTIRAFRICDIIIIRN